jgi:hypothetical protein
VSGPRPAPSRLAREIAEVVVALPWFALAPLLRRRHRRRRLLWVKPDSTWAWRLSASPDGGTRLVTRLRILYRWDRPLAASTSLLLNEFGDFAMMRRMLLTLKARAEAGP